jgi:predicted XRE-type DNA-binding protein
MRKRSRAAEKSSGNVFADLGLPNPEDRLAKAELARRISVIISEQRLTQLEAAAVLGIDQPKVSALVRGRIGGFSLERLLRFLNVLGRDVEIVVKPKPKGRRHATLSVA